MLSQNEKGGTMLRKTYRNLSLHLDVHNRILRIEFSLLETWVEVDSVLEDRTPDIPFKGSMMHHGFDKLPALAQVHAGDRCVDLREGSPDLIHWVPTAGEANIPGSHPIPVIAEPMDDQIFLDLHRQFPEYVTGPNLMGEERDGVCVDDVVADDLVKLVGHAVLYKARLMLNGLSLFAQKTIYVVECDLKGLPLSKFPQLGKYAIAVLVSMIHALNYN